MAYQWTSGTTLELTGCARAGRLYQARLRLTAGAEAPVAGFGPHFLYRPEFSEHGRGRRSGGDGAPTTGVADLIEYRLDLGSVWIPRNGGLAIQGGSGGTYDVSLRWWEQERPLTLPTITMRDVRGANDVPPYVYAVKVPEPNTLTFTFAGEARTMIAPGGQWVELGGIVGSGPGATVTPAAAAPFMSFRVALPGSLLEDL